MKTFKGDIPEEKYKKYEVFATKYKDRFVCSYNKTDFNDVLNVLYSDRTDLIKYCCFVDYIHDIKHEDLILN